MSQVTCAHCGKPISAGEESFVNERGILTEDGTLTNRRTEGRYHRSCYNLHYGSSGGFMEELSYIAENKKK